MAFQSAYQAHEKRPSDCRKFTKHIVKAKELRAFFWWDEFAKKSPMAKKVIDSQKEWLKELKLID